MHRSVLIGVFGLTLVAPIGSPALRSNIDPTRDASVSEAIGVIDWHPDGETGARINAYYCGGYLHGASVGWIQLGAGVPANKHQYSNQSAEDFGVNVAKDGALRGFAYAANLGWLQFESSGNPRVDWTTGKLSGAVWSANAGWIQLDGAGATVYAASAAASEDTDGDGLPDAWEIAESGVLTTLAAGGDADRDGVADRDEYLGGTAPLNRADFLGPVSLAVASPSGLATLRWPTKAGYLYQIDRRDSLSPETAWQPAGGRISGTGAIAARQLSGTSAAQSYYRVRVFPPLSAP